MKQIYKIGMFVISIVLLLFMGMFLVIFYDQAVDQYLISEISNISHSIADNVGLGAGYSETLTSLDGSYSSRYIPFDVFFVLIFIMAFSLITKSSLEAKKQGVFSFFGYIFLGSMMFLMSMFFIAQFTEYFITNIYIPIFNDTIIDTPITFFFFTNVKWIAFALFLWCGMINQFDLKGIQRSVSDRFSGGLQR